MKRENRSSRNLAISYYILTSGQSGTVPAPNQFSVAARTIWADDRKDDERLSSQTATLWRVTVKSWIRCQGLIAVHQPGKKIA
jgi:hypothetical protein